MIPSVCLFTNVHGINQQYKLKPKIMVDRSFYVIRFLYKLEIFRGTAGTAFSIAIPLQSLNHFEALSKNQNLHRLKRIPTSFKRSSKPQLLGNLLSEHFIVEFVLQIKRPFQD